MKFHITVILIVTFSALLNVITHTSPQKSANSFSNNTAFGALTEPGQFILTIGSEGNERGLAVAAGDDAIYLGGQSRSVSQGIPMEEQYKDYFLSSYDLSGNPVWESSWRITGATLLPGITDIAVDNDGNIYLLGHYVGAMEFLTPQDVSPGGTQGISEMYLLKFNSSGEVLWFRDWRTVDLTGLDLAWPQRSRVCCDAVGNTYILGYCEELRKFSPDGELLWAYSFAGEGTDLCCDEDGSVYLTGFAALSYLNPDDQLPLLPGLDADLLDPVDSPPFLIGITTFGELSWIHLFNGRAWDNHISLSNQGLLCVFKDGDHLSCFSSTGEQMWDINTTNPVGFAILDNLGPNFVIMARTPQDEGIGLWKEPQNEGPAWYFVVFDPNGDYISSISIPAGDNSDYVWLNDMDSVGTETILATGRFKGEIDFNAPIIGSSLSVENSDDILLMSLLVR